MLWFYTPPNISSRWSNFSPPADPSAYVIPSEPSPYSPSVSVKQTLVENHGQITGGQINGNTLISETDSPQKHVGVLIGKGVKGRIPDITGAVFCFGGDWKCFLSDAKVQLQNGQTEKFDDLVLRFNRVIDIRTLGHPNQAKECHQEVANAVLLLRGNAKDESATVKSLLSDVPVCFKQP